MRAAEFLLIRGQGAKHRFRRLSDPSGDPPCILVPRDGERQTLSAMPCLPQRMGEMGKGRDAVAAVADRELDQSRLEAKAGASCGFLDDLAAARGIERPQQVHAAADGVAEERRRAQCVERIRAHCQQDRPAVGTERTERAEDVLARLGSEAEELLGLVDDDDRGNFTGRAKLTGRGRRRRHDPRLPSGLGQSRENPCKEERGLTTARRTCHRHDRTRACSLNHGIRILIAAEEELGVLRAERAQPGKRALR